MNTNQIIIAAVAALILPACTQRYADLTFTSTKNLDMNYPKGYYADPSKRTVGEDVGHLVIVVPTRIPNAKEAADRAIEKNGSNCVGLSNMKLEHSIWYIPYIYGRETFSVTGDPVFKK